MSKVDPAYITGLVTAVLAALRRSGRLPTRLDEEDMHDLQSEGTIAALLALAKFDPDRGALRTYLDKPITRAILREAWRIANHGITGDHKALQVWSMDEGEGSDADNESEYRSPTAYGSIESLTSPDVAEEIEAFDHVWNTRYERNST